jgi:CheY-like chemotaxis protein
VTESASPPASQRLRRERSAGAVRPSTAHEAWQGVLATLAAAPAASRGDDTALRTFVGELAELLDDVLVPIDLMTDILGASVPQAEQARWTALGNARRRALSLTDGLRAVGGQVRPRPRPLDLGTSLSRQLNRVRANLPATVELSVHCEIDDGRLTADPMMLERMLGLLLDDAAGAVGPGGRIRALAFVQNPPGTVRDRLLLKSAALAHLVIADDGFRTPAARDAARGMAAGQPVLRGGDAPFFGLSWAAADGIARAHGGRLLVEIPPEGGACAHLLLPLGSEPRDLGAVAPRRRRRVLIVDDERLVRFSIMRVLESAGLEPLTADDGPQALRLLEREGDTVSLALLDLNLPGMDGQTCLGLIREHLPDLPVVCMSGLPQEAVHSLEADANVRLIEKPFLSPELMMLIEDLLGSR